MAQTLEDLLEDQGRRIRKLELRRGPENPFPRLLLAENLGRRNLVRNARFRVNQRGVVAGSFSNAYFLDGWKTTISATLVGLSGSTEAGRIVTIDRVSSTGRIAQDIERSDIIAGDYILAWKGTARARGYNAVTGSAGSYTSADPSGVTAVAVSIDGTEDYRIEFGNAVAGVPLSLEWVALVRAAEWSGYFPDIGYAEDLLWCQRYFVQWSGSTSLQLAFGMGNNGGNTLFNLMLPIPMRATPTVSATGTWRATLLGVSDIAVSGFTIVGMSGSIVHLSATHATAAAGSLRGINPTAAAWTFALSAEI